LKGFNGNKGKYTQKSMKIYPLNFFVKRVLLIRLCAATAIIAVTIGAAAYFVQNSKLSNRVIDLGRKGIATLVDRVRVTMEQEHIDNLSALLEVAGRSEPPVVYRAGRFVNYQVYDRDHRILAEASVYASKIPNIQTFLNSRPLSFPETGNEEAFQVNIDGTLFVYVAAPIISHVGEVVAYVRGIFSVSPEMEAEIHKGVFRSVFIAIAIVISVAALLYPVILQLMRRLADYSTHLIDANLETLSVLGSAIAKRDSDTDAHNFRVSLYSAKIGEAIGLPNSAMRELIKGSFLHDVGKIGIPDNILLKPGKLDKNEFSIMQTHVEKGIDIIRRSSWLRDSIAVVGNHHEKYGGGGYPGNLSGDRIPITARIFAIADVFDALTSVRPYKKSLTFGKSMEILEEGRGTHFDPKILDVFTTIARDLYDQYAGHDGNNLRQDLAAVVEKYFYAGMEPLSYGRSS